MPTNKFAETVPFYGVITIGPANTTTMVQSSPTAALQHRFDTIIASSTSVVDKYVTLEVYVGVTEFKLGSVNVPAGAGYLDIPAVNILAALFPTGFDGLVLPASALLRAAVHATLGAGEAVVLSLIGGYV